MKLKETSPLPQRMIEKIDIEKAFDTVELKTIIASLQQMDFPEAWISWVNLCLSFAYFSFLIIGTPTSWITSSRGVR